MQILDKTQIRQKIDRLAYQILESNFDEKEIILAGINQKGLAFATLIRETLSTLSDLQINLTQIRLNPAKPLHDPVEIDMSPDQLKGRTVIVVDDVANTGRTIFYAVKPLLQVLPKKVQVAVLVDRKHKTFPVAVDYVGISLATTIQEDIDVQIRDPKQWAVFLR